MNAIQYICFCLDRIAEMAMNGMSGVEISEEIRRLKKTLIGEEKVIINGTIKTEESAEAAERLQPNVPVAIQNMNREQAADYIKNKCRDCGKQIHCTGYDAEKCNKNVTYLLDKYQK